jgi:hypothetical protein
VWRNASICRTFVARPPTRQANRRAQTDAHADAPLIDAVKNAATPDQREAPAARIAPLNTRARAVGASRAGGCDAALMVDDADLAARLARLTLESKVRLLTGADFWSLHAEPAAGLRRLVLSDGPAGVRGELWDERETSANVPSPTALAATWDEELVADLGRLLAAECRRKGVDVLLAPTVNLHRTPFGGRHFECFSEDPLLSARIGVAYVRGGREPPPQPARRPPLRVPV